VNVPLIYTALEVGSVSDRVQIGPKIDGELWRRFREDVKARKGQTRGVLGDELENAIRQYLAADQDSETDDRLRRIEHTLSRIADAEGVAGTDGGTDALGAPGHTHAPSRVTDATEERPAPNAATDEKVAYLAARLRERVGNSDGEIREAPADALREVVKDEYSFRADTAKRYVDRLEEYFGLVDHPEANPLLVTPERREELLEKYASDTLEDLDE